ncbi:conserved Plasmodium protein, unknown function [Plasmodium vinckei petteri]|uniref:Uncharacterized protein n=1 Tax=Plasmodium vinckei petteri TaxID=138298 RepID=A0A6V7SAL3_PLAVN|nr:conserved Plasmodium protein, unknown function [Plasmodium vinckei petteri]
MFFLFLYNIILNLCFASAQTAVVYDENEKSMEFHIILWNLWNFPSCKYQGLTAIFQDRHIKHHKMKYPREKD